MAGTLFDIPGAATAKLDGTATAADVLAGKTFYSTDQRSKLTGTMPNNGTISKSITPTLNSQNYTIPPGYHPGTGKVTVEPIVGGSETKILKGNGANHETATLDFNLPVRNKLHICVSSFWARGNFVVYGLKNGSYIQLHSSPFPVDPNGINQNLGISWNGTGSYDAVRIVMTRDEIYNNSCDFAVTVSTL